LTSKKKSTAAAMVISETDRYRAAPRWLFEKNCRCRAATAVAVAVR
jgi:hypothetical protein